MRQHVISVAATTATAIQSAHSPGRIAFAASSLHFYIYFIPLHQLLPIDRVFLQHTSSHLLTTSQMC
ncbi:hypothetical protein ACQRIU_006607 [Beauveria bassiana]